MLQRKFCNFRSFIFLKSFILIESVQNENVKLHKRDLESLIIQFNAISVPVKHEEDEA